MSTSDDLKRAYRLIKRDQPEEARALIRPILDAEPNNAHAWWLLAYAIDDPNEVRYALNRVLEIDPNYTNAPKAREMLARINEQFPPKPERPAFADAFEAEGDTYDQDFLSASPFDEEPPILSADTDIFTDTGHDFFHDDDLFGVPDEALDSVVEPAARSLRREDLQAVLDPEVPLDAEARAALEEKAARRQGTAGRLLRLALIVITIPILVGLALFLLFSEDEEEPADLAPLESVQVQSDIVSEALVSTGSELRLANLSNESEVVVAKTEAGDTLFIQLCSQPTPNLPALAMQGMDLAARQAPVLEGELDAVGVAIHLCGSAKADALYRAYVPLQDAIRYANGELGEGAAGQAAFQRLWKTP